MRRVLHLAIALSLTLVSDKAFNGGEIAMKLFANGAAAEQWVADAGEHVAHSVSGF